MEERHMRLIYSLGLVGLSVLASLAMMLNWYSTGSPTADMLIAVFLAVVTWSFAIRSMWRAWKEWREARRELREAFAQLPRPGVWHSSDGSRKLVLLVPTESREFIVIDFDTEGPALLDEDDKVFARINGKYRPVDVCPPDLA